MHRTKVAIRLLVYTVTIFSCCTIAETTQASTQGKTAHSDFLQQRSTKNVLIQSQILNDFNKVAVCLPLVGCVDTPSVPSLEDLLKGEVYKQLANVLGQEEPIASSASEVFPTVDSLPGGAFRPVGVSIFLNRQIRTSVDGTVMLPSGDYTIPVDVFCMKHSASSPSGHRYLLARLKGKMADVITALNSRSVDSGIPHKQLQVLSWNIQAGMKYEAMPPDNRAIVDKLLPDYKSRMQHSFLESVESQYNQFRFANLPSFDSVLDRLGDLGNKVKQYRQFSSNLSQYGGDYNSLSRLLITSGESNARGGVNNTPWSKISDRVYGRMVTDGNAATPGELQIRVLEASNPNTSSQKPDPNRASQNPIDITNLVAEPQNSNIQPLSMSPRKSKCGLTDSDSNDVTNVTEEEMKQEVNKVREKFKGSNWIDNYVVQSDSKFHDYANNQKKFCFRDKVLTGHELNYYFQGVLNQYYFNQFPTQLVLMVGWKFYNIKPKTDLIKYLSLDFLPTSNEYWAAKQGYDDYEHPFPRMRLDR